jgi:hypothetical protein
MAEAFPISGNIDPKTFPFLLADLHRQGATGSLKVEGPSYPKALYFRGGRILFGSSNDPRDQLGSILIESGKISQEQLDEVNTKVGPGNPLAKVLAESGFVNQRELSESARVKVERILSDVISYSEGSFEFEDGVLPKGAVDLKLSTEKLLLAAVGRLSDRGFVLRHLDSLAVVLKPTGDMAEKMAELRPEAGDLPERLDGQRTLKEAASLTRLDEFEAAKVACTLLFFQLVEKVAPAVTATPASEVVDLAEDAQIGLAGGGPTPVAPRGPNESGPAFFVPEEESKDDFSVDMTLPQTKAPSFGDSETPPLGLPKASTPTPRAAAPPVAPMAPVPQMEEEDPEPTVSEMSSPAASPAEDSLDLDDTEHDTMPRISFEPPRTEAMEIPSLVPSIVMPPPAPPASVPTMPDFSAANSEPLGFEEEPTHDAVPPARPSREDLAALDALLNPSASVRSAATTVQRPRAERWEPQMRPASSGSTPTASRPSRRRQAFPVVPVAIGIGLATAAGLGAWYYLRPPAAAPNKPIARVTPRPPSSVPTSLPTPAGTEATAAVDPAVPASTPPTTSVAAATLPPATSPPTTVKAAALPPPTTAAPQPPPTTAPAAAKATGLAGARQSLQQRDFKTAAQGFVAGIRSSREARYSVQLLVACADETVEKALANASAPELLILPVSYQGRSCYRLCWGLYDSEANASSAASSVPAYFRDGGAKPKVAAIAALLP